MRETRRTYILQNVLDINALDARGRWKKSTDGETERIFFGNRRMFESVDDAELLCALNLTDSWIKGYVKERCGGLCSCPRRKRPDEQRDSKL